MKKQLWLSPEERDTLIAALMHVVETLGTSAKYYGEDAVADVHRTSAALMQRRLHELMVRIEAPPK